MKSSGLWASLRTSARFRVCAFALAVVVILLPGASPRPSAQPPAVDPARHQGRGLVTEPICAGEAAAGQFLVKVTGCASRTSLFQLTRRLRGFLRSFTEDNTATVRQVGSGHLFLLKSRRNVKDLTERFNILNLNNLSFWPNSTCVIDYAEPNFVVRTDGADDPPQGGTEPDDDFFQEHRMWGLENTGLPACAASCGGCLPGTAGVDIGAVAAWRFSKGSRRIVVGVLDNGVAYTHEDLRHNMWSAPNRFRLRINGVPILCPRGSHGFDALDMRRPCQPMARHNNHGTHVAGIIGAEGGNGKGVVGVNWKVSLLALRFMDGDEGLISDAISAMDFLLFVKQKFKDRAAVRVLNNSWGIRILKECESKALREKIDELGAADVLFVASAGNDGQNNDVSPHYPSNYNLDNVLAVTAIDNLGNLATASNGASYGKTTVHLGAPGQTIISTCAGAGFLCVEHSPYCYMGGTSMAAPHAAGAAALVLSVPDRRCLSLSARGLRDLLRDSAYPTPSLSDITISGGRLNVYDAISRCRASP